MEKVDLVLKLRHEEKKGNRPSAMEVERAEPT